MSDNAGELLMSAARVLRRGYGAALAEWEITPAQSRALRIVCELESARISVVAEKLRIAPRSATEVVDALEKRGLVTRVDDRLDRRATCVLATEEGIRLRTVLDEARTAEAERFLSVLTTDERAELARILARLAEER